MWSEIDLGGEGGVGGEISEGRAVGGHPSSRRGQP